jgi:very-short-patch-repair endonuclease/predicted transcriptional regulator of viral defense system
MKGPRVRNPAPPVPPQHAAGNPPLDHASVVSERRRVQRLVEALAARQHGIVTRKQLREAGLGEHAVDNLVKRGHLHAIHRGVYRVGPLVAVRAREMAAVLASGAGACISHHSAAVLWELLPPGSAPAVVAVIVRGRHRRVRPGIASHREPTLRADEVTHLEGIPITTAARTMLDLAGLTSSRQLERALARCQRIHPAAWDALPELLRRHPRHPGSRRLRAILGSGTTPALTRSEAEERLLALIRRGRLREPEANVRIHGLEVDFLWRAERLVVEVDGFAFHSSKRAFEGDRLRDGDLVGHGLRVARVTWHQLTNEPEALLVRLTRAIDHKPTGAPP